MMIVQPGRFSPPLNTTALLLMPPSGTGVLGTSDLLGNTVTPGGASWTPFASPLSSTAIDQQPFEVASGPVAAMERWTVEWMIYETAYVSQFFIKQNISVRVYRGHADSRFRVNIDGVATLFDTSADVALLNQWNCMMMEYDSGNYRLTCNGMEIGSRSNSTPWTSGPVSFSIAVPPAYLSGARVTPAVRYPGTNPDVATYVDNYLT